MNDRAKEYKYIRRRFGIRLLSGLLGIIFFITTVGAVDSVFASVNPSVELSASPVLESLKSLRLPEAFGHIVETFEPSEQSPKIILIQDAHDIPDAQRSIRHILLFLQKQYGVRQVAVEGAAQKLDPQMFKSFPDKKLLSSVMRKLMDRGELSGSAAAAVMGTEGSAVEPDYFGVEDWPLYEKGLELYLEAMARQKVAVRRLDLSWETLELAKQENYSKQLRDVDLAETQFRENKKDLMGFLEVLSAIQPPTAQSEIALFLAEAKKQTASHTALELEVRRIAKDFKMRSEEWSPESRRLFNQQWQSFQTGDTHAEQFALSLNEIAGKEKIDITMSKRLLLGAANQKRLHDIEGTQFFKSIEDYTRSVKDALFVTAEDRELDRKTRALLLQKKLATLELSREEWDMVKAKVVDQNSDDGLPQDLFSAKSFYENAEKRDQALFDQLKKRAQLGLPLVMVAGGFHAQGLMERLRKAGLAYVLVMPNIQQLPETTNYRAHMQGDVSWKSYFKIEKGRINLYAPFVRYVRDELLKKARISEPLLKSWRDQLIRDMARQGRIEQVGGYTQYLDETLEKSKVIPQEGLAKLDRFFEGLRLLDREGRFKAPDILQLLKPASAVPSGPIAGALTHQSLAVAAMSRVPLRPDVAPAEISRSEVRAESAVFSKENVRIVIAEDMKIISGPLSVKLTGLGYRKVWTVSTLGELKAMMDSSEGLPEVLILDRHLENGEDAVKYIAQLRREGQLIGKDRGGTLVIWNSFTAPAEDSAEVDLVTSGLYDGRPMGSMKGKLSPEAMGERLEQAMLILNSRPAAGEKDNLRAKVSSEFAPVSDDDRNRHEIIQSINSVLGNELTDKQGVKFRVELLPSTGLPVIPENAVSVSLRLSHAAVQLDLSFDILPNLIRFSDQSLDLEDPIKRAMMMRLILEFAAKIQIPHGDLYLESIVEDQAALKALSLQMREKLLAILPGDSISQVPKKAAKEDLIALLDNYVGLPQGAHGIVVDPEKLMDGPYANSTPVWRLHDQFGLAHSLDVVGDPDKRQVVLVTRQINSRFVLHQLKGVLGTLTDLLIPSIESRNGIQDVMKKGGVLFEKVPVFYAELLDLDNLHAKKNVRESMEFVQKIYEAFSTAKIERTLRKLKSAFGEKISEADLEQIRTTALFVQDAAADWLGHKEDFFHEVSVEDFMKRVSQLAAPEGTDLVRFLMDDRVRKTRIEIMPQTLIEILINLVRNSRQAIEHYEQSLEGKAVVYVPEITVKAQKFKSTVRITVSDNGPGMTADQVEKANRGISFTSDYKPDSTGVGLPSSRNQIEGLFYGQWAVTSKLADAYSHGETSIVMTLPIRQPKRSEVRGFQITPRGKPTIDERVRNFERAMLLPIARGMRWKRLVTPKEAQWFDQDYHSAAVGEYTVVFNGAVYNLSAAVFEKMKAWADLSRDYERTGYFVVRKNGERNVLIDFKPTASLVLGLGASEEQRTNQMVYGLSDFAAMGVDPELASNLTVQIKRSDGSFISERGFSVTVPAALDFDKLAASEEGLSRLDWHSHYESSFYSSVPSPEDHRSAQAASSLYWVGDDRSAKDGHLIFYDGQEGNRVLLEPGRSEVRGLRAAPPEAMWNQLRSVLARANQLFIKEALNNDWVSSGPASRTFSRNISELIPGATASVIYVSKFRQDSLHDPALFLTLQTLVELIRDFSSQNKLAPEGLLGLIFGKTVSHQATVLQSISQNNDPEKTLEVIAQHSIRAAGVSREVLVNLLNAINQKFSEESAADRLNSLARQLMFYPGGYPTPPTAPAMLPLFRIPTQYLVDFPMLASPFESYGASRHIASLVHVGGRTHLVDLTVSQYDGTAYPVTQVFIIEDVNDAKLIEHGYILERIRSLEAITEGEAGDRDAALSYLPFVEQALADKSAAISSSDDTVKRSEVRTAASELRGDEIRSRIRQAAGERKLVTGVSDEETRQAFELQMEILRLRSAIHESFHGLGDVHGGAAAVKTYLENIPSDEVILQVGDMIDRGEDSPLAVERLRSAQKEREAHDQAPIYKFLGNHEMMLLQGYLGSNGALVNWYRELPAAEREIIFEADKFNLSGDHDKDGVLARTLLQKHPRYRPMIDGMLEDIARGDLMAAAALQGQLITHAGIDPDKLLPEIEYDILQYRGIDPEALSPEQRSALVSDAEIAEFINRTVRMAFDIAGKLSAADIDPAAAFWHWIFLNSGIFWNRNMESKKQAGRRQSFGHTPKPNLTVFNQGLFVNFDTAIYRSKDPISMFVNREGSVMSQSVVMDMLYHDQPIVEAAAFGSLPDEIASPELQRGWPEFENFENLPRKVTVDAVTENLKGLEVELFEKIMAMPEEKPGEPLFSEEKASMLAARLVNQYPPGVYIFVYYSGRWFAAEKSEWMREQNLGFLRPIDWQDLTRVRGYGALLYNDEIEKGEALAEIYNRWDSQANADPAERQTSILEPVNPALRPAELTLNGLTLKAEMTADGGLKLSASGMTTIFIPLPMLESGQVLGRTHFKGVDKSITDGISRNHFQVRAYRMDVADPDDVNIQVRVQELGSTNGTKLGGQPLFKDDPPSVLVEAVLPRANLRSEVRVVSYATKFPADLEGALEARRSLIQSDQVDAIDALLFQRFHEKYIRITLRDQGDLDRLISRVRIDQGEIMVSDGALLKIIRDGGVLLIDYAGSDPKLVDGLNKLLDVQNASYRGVPVSPDLRVIGVVNEPIHTFDTPFKRRFAGKKIRLNKLSYKDPVAEQNRFQMPQGVDAIVAELDDSPEVEETLLGRTYFDAVGRLAIEKDPPLLRAIQSGLPLMIRGATLFRNPELERFMRQLLLRREYEYNGVTHQLPQEFKVYLDEGNYGREIPVDKYFVSQFDPEDSAYVVNNETRDLLFEKTFSNDSGLLAQGRGLLETEGPPLHLLITENMPDWVWHKILKSSRIIYIEIRDSVVIPAVYQTFAKEQLNSQSQFHSAEAPSTWVTAESAVLRGDDLALISQQIKDRFKNEEVVEFFVGPQTSAVELFEALEFPTGRTPKGQPAAFTKKAFLEAIERGAVVVLEGVENNVDLQRSLESLLVEHPYYMKNGKRYDLRHSFAQVYVLTHNPLSVSAKTEAVISGEPDQTDLKMILEREFPSRFQNEDADSFEKIQRLIHVFSQLPSPRRTGDYPDHFSLNLDRLRQLYRFKNWSQAFERYVISQYESVPEVAAFMRVMVRLVFEDESGPLNSVDETRATSAINATVGLQLKEQNFWQFADSLSTDLLKRAIQVEQGFDSQDMRTVFEKIGLAFVHAVHAKDDETLKAYYRSLFALPEGVDADLDPQLVSISKLTEREAREAEIDQIADDLAVAKVAFFQGSPGTGKSYSVAEVARKLGFDPKAQVVRVTTGRDASYGDVVAQQGMEASGKTKMIEGAVAQWAKLSEGGILQVDEANLPKGTHFWDFLKGLFADKPFVDVDGERVFLSDRHLIIFTGNENALEGRHEQAFIRDYAMTVPFRSFSPEFLREEALVRLQQLEKTTHQPKQNLEALAVLIVELQLLFDKLHGGRDFSIRDVLELTERSFYKTGEVWSPDEIILLAWDQYSGFFDKAERSAFEITILFQFGVQIGALYQEKTKQLSEKIQSSEAFKQAGIVLTPSVKEVLTAAQIFLEVTNAHAKTAQDQPSGALEKYKSLGKKGMLFEGHAGRGKDLILTALFEALDIPYEHISASLDTEELEAAIKRAMTQGSVLLVSELNLLDSAYLEGKLNDVLTGDAAEGFAFFATINSADYSGREKMSTALQNRLLYHRLDDYNADEFHQLAEARRGQLSEAQASQLVDFHLWVIHSIPQPNRRPSAAEFLRALSLMRDENRPLTEAVTEVYGLGYLEGILGEVRLPNGQEIKSAESKEKLEREKLSRRVLQLIAEMIIPREKGPVTIDTTDEKDSNNEGYYVEARNLIHLEPDLFSNGGWLSTLLHEASHGLFTRGRVSSGFISDMIRNDFEDLRHTAAFDRFFPHAGISRSGSELERFAQAAAQSAPGILDLSAWVKESNGQALTPRVLFRIALMAYGKRLVTRRQLTDLAARWEGQMKDNSLSLALKVLDAVDRITEAIPKSLTENEIKKEQFRASTAMQTIDTVYAEIGQSHTDITGNVPFRERPPINPNLSAVTASSSLELSLSEVFLPEARTRFSLLGRWSYASRIFYRSGLKRFGWVSGGIGITLAVVYLVANFAERLLWMSSSITPESGTEPVKGIPPNLSPSMPPEILNGPMSPPDFVNQLLQYSSYAGLLFLALAVVYFIVSRLFPNLFYGQASGGGLGVHRGEGGRKGGAALTQRGTNFSGEISFNVLRSRFPRIPEMQRISGLIQRDLASLLKGFSTTRLQSDKVYGPTGTIDLSRYAANAPPNSLFRKNGGVSEPALMHLKVGVQTGLKGHREFEELNHQGLAEFLHLYQEMGGEVSLVYGTEPFDTVTVTGSSAFVHADHLAASIEPYYISGLINQRLGERKNAKGRIYKANAEKIRLSNETGLHRSLYYSPSFLRPEDKSDDRWALTLDASEEPWSWEQVQPLRAQITALDIVDPSLTEASRITEWPALRSLVISKTNISDLSPLWGLPLSSVVLPETVSDEQVRQFYQHNPSKHISIITKGRVYSSNAGAFEIQEHLQQSELIREAIKDGGNWYWIQNLFQLGTKSDHLTLDLSDGSSILHFFEMFDGKKADDFFEFLRASPHLKSVKISGRFWQEAAKHGIDLRNNIIQMIQGNSNIEALDLVVPGSYDLSWIGAVHPLKKLSIASFNDRHARTTSRSDTEIDLHSIGFNHRESLESLSIIWGDLPVHLDTLASFQNLKEFRLTSGGVAQSAFVGYEFDLSFLSALPNLEILQLDGLRVANPETLVSLTTLKELSLVAAEMPMPNLGSLKNLRSLRIEENDLVTQLDFLAKLQQLETLKLKSQRVTSIDSLAQLFSLKVLKIDAPKVYDVSALAGLSALRSVDLNTAGINGLSGLYGKNLSELSLYVTRQAQGFEPFREVLAPFLLAHPHPDPFITVRVNGGEDNWEWAVDFQPAKRSTVFNDPGRIRTLQIIDPVKTPGLLTQRLNSDRLGVYQSELIPSHIAKDGKKQHLDIQGLVDDLTGFNRSEVRNEEQLSDLSDVQGGIFYPGTLVSSEALRALSRSEVRSKGEQGFQEFLRRRDAERNKTTRRVFLAAAGTIGVGLIAAMTLKSTADKDAMIRRAAVRRKARGPIAANSPWNLFPLEDANLSDMEKIKLSLQVTSDWLVQEGYGETEILDEYSGYLEAMRVNPNLGQSLMGKTYNSQRGTYDIEVQSRPLLDLIRQVKKEQSMDLFILSLGGLMMRESLGLRLMLQTEDRLKEISQQTGELERERRRRMPAAQLNPDYPELRQFLKKHEADIARLLTANLALEHLEAEWEWAFYARAAQRGEYSAERLKTLLIEMKKQNLSVDRLLNSQAYSSRLLIETGGDSFEIARSQLTGVSYNNYLLFKRGELTRDKLNLPSADFLLSNYGLMHEVSRYLPAGAGARSVGIDPNMLEIMGRGQWPGFDAFDSYARRLQPDMEKATEALYKELPFFLNVVNAQRDNSLPFRMKKLRQELQETLERPRRPKRKLFDSDGEDKPAEIRGNEDPALQPLKRSEVRTPDLEAAVVVNARSELDTVGEGLAGYVYGRVTDEILSEVSDRLEDVRRNHDELSVEQIIGMVRDITFQKIKALRSNMTTDGVRGKENIVRLKDTQLLLDIVQDHVAEGFAHSNGGFTIGTSLSPNDGISMAMKLISAIQRLRDVGALKHALIVANSTQRKFLSEERANQGLSLETIELLNKLPADGGLEAHLENGQTRLPHATRANAVKESVSKWLVPIELLEDNTGLSVADLEMLEAVSVFMQLAAGVVIAREGNAAPEEIRGKLNQLLQVKGAEIDEKILNAVFKPRGEGYSLSQRGILGILQVLESQYDAIMAIRAAA